MNSNIESLMAEDKYKHIKKYEKRAKVAENILTHTDLSHMDVYSSSAMEVLGTKDPRQKDLELLKDSKKQIELADKMADKYKSGAEKYIRHLKVEGEIDMDEFDEAILTDALYGTTREHLKMYISKEKEKFTPEYFMKAKNEMMEKLNMNLRLASSSHIKDEHIDDVIKYTKVEDSVHKDYEIKKDLMQKNDAIELLNMMKQYGSIPPEAIKDKKYIVKKKKKSA